LSVSFPVARMPKTRSLIASELGSDHSSKISDEVGQSAREKDPELYLVAKRLSPWSRSGAKRFFDCACVVLALPLLAPVMLLVALAIRITSSGPIFFLQKRMGCNGQPFTILKFRTMIPATNKAHHAVTTTGNQRFTLIGPYLRRLKIDELPQLLNVLMGHMSLVGPRPKMPEHVFHSLTCRPGITGAATIAFALEESVLDRVPTHRLNAYYLNVVLPAKRKLDTEYMERATFFSDLELIVNSVLRRWDTSAMEEALNSKSFGIGDGILLFNTASPDELLVRKPVLPKVVQYVPVEHSMSFRQQ